MPKHKGLSKDRTTAYLAAIKALENLIEAEGLDKANRAYVEASACAIQESFAKSKGVTQAGGSLCVRRLLGKKCTIGYPSEVRDGASHLCLPPGSDHVSLWNEKGRALLLVSQPYGLPYRTLIEMLAFCEVHGLEVDIDAGATWYLPGQVVGVIWRKAKPLPPNNS